MVRPRLTTVVAFGAALVTWQILGRWLAVSAVPTPTAIFASVFNEWSIYGFHLLWTAENAVVGLLIGSAIGIFFGFGFHASRVFEFVFYPLGVCIFAIPVIVFAPLLAISLDPSAVPATLSALTVFFPVAVLFARALDNVPASYEALFDAFGANLLWRYIKLDLVVALPALLTGIQTAIPWAFLGSMLGEFVGGERGLGVLMLGTLGRGDPTRLWAIAAVSTLASGGAYLVAGALKNFVADRLALESGDISVEFGTRIRGRNVLSGAAIIIVGWAILRAISPLDAPLVLGPNETLSRLISDGDARGTLFAAAIATLSSAVVALLLAIIFATIWALLARVSTWAASVLSAAVFVAQATPLLALTPAIVLSFGRGEMTTLFVAFLAVVFPAYSAIRLRLDGIPRSVSRLGRVYAGPALHSLLLLQMPWLSYGIATAVRIAAPRILLGVMLAEYLATGRGLGFLMATARGQLDFTTFWGAIGLTAMLGYLLHEISRFAEQKLAGAINADVDATTAHGRTG